MNYSVLSPNPIHAELGPLNVTDSANHTDTKPSILDYTEGKIAIALNKYSLLCLCPIGIVLNSAAVVAISRLKPFNTSSLYVILLAIFDSLTLIAKLAYIQSSLNDVYLGDTGCGILSFLGSFLDQFSIWILVLLTIERFVAVWLPLKVSSWFTMSRARIAVIVTAMCLVFINFNILFMQYQDEQPHPKRGIRRDCLINPRYKYFVTRVWYWIESFISAIIPCLVLLVLNSLIVYRMRKSMEKQKQMLSGMECPNKTKQSHKTHLTVMLITISVSFVFMILPLAIFNVFRGPSHIPESLHEMAKYYMTKEVTHFIADCNHVLNFLFYFLSSRRFRRMCLYILQCKDPYLYEGLSRNPYSKSGTSTTNTYYLHTSVRANGGM